MSDNISYEKIIESHKEYVMPTYPFPELMLVKGQGSNVWDSNGNKYLDFTCGISVCNLGHCHRRVSEAIISQCSRLVHVSNLFMNDQQPVLAKKIVEHAFDGNVFFSNSGAEANEGMIKFARKWGNSKGKYQIIVMEDSFHGRTLATLSATGRKKYREGFGPDVEGFTHVPFNNLDAIKKAVKESNGKVAAVMLEPIQGEGGIIPADNEYLIGLRKFCDENEILMMFDEVQSGIGRTGKFFGYQNYDVIPDLMSMAKALGNGYPIGAFIAKKSLGNVLTPGTHASTFGGTPLASAAAISVIDTFDEERVLKNCIEMGAKAETLIKKLMNKHSIIKEIRGKGLMLGIVLDRPAGEFSKKAQAEGLLIITAGENVLRFYPSLNVSEEDLIKGIEILDRILTV